MDNEKRPGDVNVKWTEEYTEISRYSSASGLNMGEIIFRQNKRRSKIKGLLKGIAFVVIASISGAISGAMVSQINYAKNEGDPNQQIPYKLPSDGPSYSQVNFPKNSATRVTEIVGPAVVGISNNAEAFLGNSYGRFCGSGVIFDKKGYIITNYHVIEGADKIFVKLASANSNPMIAKPVRFDKFSDLAILKIEGENFPEARLGDSSRIKVGDVAIAIGNPFGEDFAGSVTAGIISATNRRFEFVDPSTKQKTVYKMLQTDAAINPGNSGGPLCNEAGEVIGIVSLKANSNYSAERMGFAISINEVKHVITSLMNEGKVSRPDLGIIGGTAVPVNSNGISGVYVQEVYQSSGAWDAGIRPTNIITELDNVKISKYEDISAIIEKHKVGDTISCKVWKNDKIEELKVKLKEQN